jgi:hypothetical protein
MRDLNDTNQPTPAAAIDRLALKMGIWDAIDEMQKHPPATGTLVAHASFADPYRLVRFGGEYAHAEDHNKIVWRVPRNEIFDAQRAEHFAQQHKHRMESAGHEVLTPPPQETPRGTRAAAEPGLRPARSPRGLSGSATA